MLAVHFGFNQPGQQIILWRRPPLRDHTREVVIHLGSHSTEIALRVGLFLAANQTIAEGQDRVAPAVEARPVRERNADHVGNYFHRQRDRKVRRQVHLSTLDHLIQQLARQLPNPRFETRDNSWGKGAHNEGAQLGVARWVREEEPLGTDTGGKRLVIVERLLDALIIEEQPGIKCRDMKQR